MRNVNELETEGWFFKVGDVYSNPYQSSHFKITKIELGEVDSPEDTLIYGYRVHPENYNQRVIDPEVCEDNEFHRAWYLNDYWDLEAP